jgi:hypothetical protein
MADLEAVLQAIRDFVAKLRATIEIEEQHRCLQDCADPSFRSARQCEDELARMLRLCNQMRRLSIFEVFPDEPDDLLPS